MLALFLMFASGAVVRQDQTQLRDGCEPRDSIVATLPAGSPTEIRFSMSGAGETCYKVIVTSGAQRFEGFLPASAIEGLETFRKSVENAPSLGVPKTQPVSNLPGRPENALSRANSLIEQNQPRAALEILEKGMKVSGRDYRILLAAGIAAYRADESRIALEYLKEAEQLHPDHAVQQLIAKLQKEKSGDQSSEKLYGTRFLLRYEGGNLAPEVARGMIALLEHEFSRIAAEVGCRTDERIVAVVQSKQAYRDSTEAAEWSGGVFDGVKIRVPVVESAIIDRQTHRALAHELVHACLASLGPWPTWLHEGLAQRLTGDLLPRARLEQVKSMIRAGKLPRLDNMNQSWSRMSALHAQRAYDYALAAVDLMYDLYRNYGIQNIFRNPDRLPQITAELDKRLAE